MRIALHFSNILILKWTIKNIDIVCGESVREGWGGDRNDALGSWGPIKTSALMLAGLWFYDEFGMNSGENMLSEES